MNNLSNRAPYLRTSREFPEEIHMLALQLNKTYVDIATAVNYRTIGIYAVNKTSITGESWFLSGIQRQQTLRQVYQFTSAGSIAHNLTFDEISSFTKIYGTFTDGTNWFPLPYVDVTSATNQISLGINPTNIVITAGAGSPPISSGFVVLEWLSDI